MSGVLSALVAGATPAVYSASVVDISGFGTVYGAYRDGSFGSSVSPQSFKTTTINNIQSRLPAAGSPDDIGIVLDGSLAQSFFTALVVQRTDGTIKRYATADATYLVFGGGTLTSWLWDNNDPSWTAAGVRFLMLYP